MEVEPPAEAELGERQQLGGGAPPERRHRADLDEAGLAHERGRPPPRDLPGRMAAQRLRGLRQVELERLAHAHEAVEERARQPHVVVDRRCVQSGVAGPRPRAAGSGSRTSRRRGPRPPCARAAARRPGRWSRARAARGGARSRSAGSASASSEPGRYTPITSTSRGGGRGARRAGAARRRVPVSVSSALEGELAERSAWRGARDRSRRRRRRTRKVSGSGRVELIAGAAPPPRDRPSARP